LIISFVHITNDNDSSSHTFFILEYQYRDGFVVDDGPYRRLDDPNNAEFLRALAMGRTPRELEDGEGASGSSNVVVGLVDKRQEEYVEQFRSFSGQGVSLGTRNSSSDGTFDPEQLPASPASVDSAQPTTSIAVRLINGKRQVVKLNCTSTVADLASHLRSVGSEPFRLVAGFPPAPLTDPSATIEGAGLKGAQVSMQSAT
jgi:UBX domain-containing protein 1